MSGRATRAIQRAKEREEARATIRREDVVSSNPNALGGRTVKPGLWSLSDGHEYEADLKTRRSPKRKPRRSKQKPPKQKMALCGCGVKLSSGVGSRSGSLVYWCPNPKCRGARPKAAPHCYCCRRPMSLVPNDRQEAKWKGVNVWRCRRRG